MDRDLRLSRVASLNVGGKKFCTSRASLTKVRVLSSSTLGCALMAPKGFVPGRRRTQQTKRCHLHQPVACLAWSVIQLNLAKWMCLTHPHGYI